MKPLLMIPLYRHARQLRPLLPDLFSRKIPILIVDDGNPEPFTAEGVSILRLDPNQGKGAAICAALAWANARGFTHLLQLDADGQHNIEDAFSLLSLAARFPDTLITGSPVFDASIPINRLKGRKITHFFLFLETGRRNEDGMCGCRVYPVARSLTVSRLVREKRMGFDIEFIVRWCWSKWPMRTAPVRVRYPTDGYSNFRLWRDNVHISRMHARLCFLRLFHLYRKAKCPSGDLG